MSTTKKHEIVVLGGNFGGLSATHYLLRHTIPALQKLDKDQTYHVTLVTPNTDFLFKPATPRILIAPELLPESKIWRPLSDGLKRYSADQVTLVQGIATDLDPAKRAITVSLKPSRGEQTLSYDTVVIATGTTSASPAYTLHDNQSLTTETFKSVKAALADGAKTVLIAGGGAVGVETAGEVASAYPSAEVTLLSGADRLLKRTEARVGTRAQDYLQRHLGVKVVHNIRVTGLKGDGPSKTATLSDETTRTVDVYIDATGGTPNSKFLPKEWLDESGRVIKKDAYFRVKGGGEDDAQGAYIIGDIVAGSNNTIFELDANVPTACSAIGVDIAAKIGQEGKAPPLKEFKPMKNTIIVPVGPSGGVGLLLGWCAPSFFVKFVKCKTFLTEMIDGIVSGDKWK
ncbi:hypothetical protein B0H66DRAFT_387393 [Apodospora peruviana]|uniref:FAD/NAD(P)-binding domain-containing protein n=1 Tax=Apodospora peruviana TaxID=516989 RepID=A0AAE0HV62_9PEZI|nr:hypothetical protein B0H66DRAFT_387393 [Apodospora peruviana]